MFRSQEEYFISKILEKPDILENISLPSLVDPDLNKILEITSINSGAVFFSLFKESKELCFYAMRLANEYAKLQIERSFKKVQKLKNEYQCK